MKTATVARQCRDILWVIGSTLLTFYFFRFRDLFVFVFPCLSLSCQWVGANLEPDQVARFDRPALDVPRGVRTVGGVESLSLPTGVRVVDAAVHAAAVERHRERHAHRHPLLLVRQEGEQ